MKKYIIPNTETIDFIQGTALCSSPNAGLGQQQNPSDPSSNDPNAAPGRKVF